MKSLDDLKKIKSELVDKMSIRSQKDGYKVIVAMGEVGLANGARAVANSLAEEVFANNLHSVTVLIDGNIETVEADGVVVKVVDEEGKETLYGKVCPTCAKKIIAEHVMKGQVVTDLVVAKCGE
jgi:NADP-reducing hydrogenase subunit HndB